MSAPAKDTAARPAPTVRPPRSRAVDRLLRASLWPLIVAVCGGMMAALSHRTGLAITGAAAGTVAAAALAGAAGVLAVRNMRLNPWPAAAAAAAVAGAAGWRLLPLAGLSWLRALVVAGAVAGIVKAIPAGVRYHRRHAAYHRWAQAVSVVLAQGNSQIEQVLAGLAGRAHPEHITEPHFGAAPNAAWTLRVTEWAGDQIKQAVLKLPAHDDISNPDLEKRIRAALTRRAGVASLSLSVSTFRDEITITVTDGSEKDTDPATVKERAIERVKTVAEMALKNVQVLTVDIDEDAAVPAGEGLAGAGHALRAFEISYDPHKIVTSPASRDQITQHISTQLFGRSDRLRDLWEVDFDRATFKLRREFPPFIPHPILDLSDLYPGRLVLPYGEDEDGNIVVYPLSKTTLPHGLVIGPTGGGKTQLLLLIAIEAARQGVEVRGCDPKMIELMGLRGWPNVTQIATRTPDMIMLIEDAHAEMYLRFEAIATGKVPRGGFRRLLIILDEYFVFCMLVAAWWADNRDPSDPKTHAVIQKIGELAALSRGADINLVLGCQRPDSTFFYEGARDNFGWRVSLGQLSQQGALMLWGDARTGTDLPLDVPGLCTATTPAGPVRAKVHFVPNPADALNDQLTDADLACLRTLLPDGTTWDGPLSPSAPDPGFEMTAAVQEAVATDPVTGFLTLIRAALSSRTAHLTAVPGGGPPAGGDDAGLYGWGAGPGGKPERSGKWIGSVEDTRDGRRVYLYPERAYETARAFAKELLEPFDLGPDELGEAMRRSSLLKTEGKGEERWTVRRPAPGNDLSSTKRPRFWDIPEDVLLGEKPVPPPELPGAPAAGPEPVPGPETPPGPVPVSRPGPVTEPETAPARLSAVPEKRAHELTDGDRVILVFDDDQTMHATVWNTEPDPTTATSPEPDGAPRLILNYFGDNTEPGYVRVRHDHLFTLAPPGSNPGGIQQP